MIEVEWWEYDDAGEMAEALAGDARFVIESALDARGDAAIALPGSLIQKAALEQLGKSRLKWRDVTIIPTDDLLISVEDEQSRARQLAQLFLPLGARVLPLTGGDLAVEDAGKAADARLQAIHWPLDVVWLEAGADGNAAAIYPGPDLEAALSSHARAIGLTPDPAPADSAMARITLTKKAVLDARAIMLSVRGADARRIVEQAISDASDSVYPIGRLLADSTQAIDIHWCP